MLSITVPFVPVLHMKGSGRRGKPDEFVAQHGVKDHKQIFPRKFARRGADHLFNETERAFCCAL
jgi:hypothetical protein